MRRAIGLVCLALLSGLAQAQGIRVVNEGGIRDEWTLPAGTKLAVPAYPTDYANQPSEACVAIGYLIHEDGSTSDYALVKSWTAAEMKNTDEQAYWGVFAQAAAQALQQWRFQPRPEIKAARPVYTVATFVFGSSNPLELRKRCAITDLVRHLMALRQNRGSRRLVNAAVWDRLELDPMHRERSVTSSRY
jgi:hypothetical protein